MCFNNRNNIYELHKVKNVSSIDWTTFHDGSTDELKWENSVKDYVVQFKRSPRSL